VTFWKQESEAETLERRLGETYASSLFFLSSPLCVVGTVKALVLESASK
jgi:hypothetical protein